MSGLCIGTNNNGLTSGTNVELEDCTGAEGQKWTYSS